MFANLNQREQKISKPFRIFSFRGLFGVSLKIVVCTVTITIVFFVLFFSKQNREISTRVTILHSNSSLRGILTYNIIYIYPTMLQLQKNKEYKQAARKKPFFPFAYRIGRNKLSIFSIRHRHS